MGFLTGLTLLLIAAKLFGYAHYSWLVASTPIIVSLSFSLLVGVSAVILQRLSDR